MNFGDLNNDIYLQGDSIKNIGSEEPLFNRCLKHRIDLDQGELLNADYITDKDIHVYEREGITFSISDSDEIKNVHFSYFGDDYLNVLILNSENVITPKRFKKSYDGYIEIAERKCVGINIKSNVKNMFYFNNFFNVCVLTDDGLYVYYDYTRYDKVLDIENDDSTCDISYDERFSYFYFLHGSKLWKVTCSLTSHNLQLISDKCTAFAIDKNSELFYIEKVGCEYYIYYRNIRRLLYRDRIVYFNFRVIKIVSTSEFFVILICFKKYYYFLVVKYNNIYHFEHYLYNIQGIFMLENLSFVSSPLLPLFFMRAISDDEGQCLYCVTLDEKVYSDQSGQKNGLLSILYYNYTFGIHLIKGDQEYPYSLLTSVKRGNDVELELFKTHNRLIHFQRKYFVDDAQLEMNLFEVDECGSTKLVNFHKKMELDVSNFSKIVACKTLLVAFHSEDHTLHFFKIHRKQIKLLNIKIDRVFKDPEIILYHENSGDDSFVLLQVLDDESFSYKIKKLSGDEYSINEEPCNISKHSYTETNVHNIATNINHLKKLLSTNKDEIKVNFEALLGYKEPRFYESDSFILAIVAISSFVCVPHKDLTVILVYDKLERSFHCDVYDIISDNFLLLDGTLCEFYLLNESDNNEQNILTYSLFKEGTKRMKCIENIENVRFLVKTDYNHSDYILLFCSNSDVYIIESHQDIFDDLSIAKRRDSEYLNHSTDEEQDSSSGSVEEAFALDDVLFINEGECKTIIFN